MNNERKFAPILAKIKEMSRNREEALGETIKLFIKDLDNYGEDQYEINVIDIPSMGLKPETVQGCKEYLKDYLKEMNKAGKKGSNNKNKEEIETIWEQVNKDNSLGSEENIKEVMEEIKHKLNGKTRKTILKRLEAKLNEMRKQRETDEKINEITNEIIKKGEKEYNRGKRKSEYYKQVKGIVQGRKNLSDDVRSQVIKKIEEERYFNAVMEYTDNAEFLTAEEMSLQGKRGQMLKFSNLDDYEKFESLRVKIQKGKSEKNNIENLLKKEGLNNASIRILEARIKVLREREKENEIETR